MLSVLTHLGCNKAYNRVLQWHLNLVGNALTILAVLATKQGVLLVDTTSPVRILQAILVLVSVTFLITVVVLSTTTVSPSAKDKLILLTITILLIIQIRIIQALITPMLIIQTLNSFVSGFSGFFLFLNFSKLLFFCFHLCFWD